MRVQWVCSREWRIELYTRSSINQTSSKIVAISLLEPASHTRSSETVTAVFGTLQLYLKSPRQDSARDMGGNLRSVQQSGGPCHHSGLFFIRPRHCDWSAASKRFCRKLSLSSICCISWKQQQQGQVGSPSLRGWLGGGGGVMLWGRGGGGYVVVWGWGIWMDRRK